jgi:hypothetical protein
MWAHPFSRRALERAGGRRDPVGHGYAVAFGQRLCDYRRAACTSCIPAASRKKYCCADSVWRPGASGRVVVTVQSGAFSVSVFASGLAPMSAHTVHLHAGNCGFAYAGRHLLVLGRLVTSESGNGSLSAVVGFPYSTGRFVIVYAGLTPGTILGCADLGPI